MTTALRIAVTADLHWGHHARGVEATRLLVSFLESQPPDVLVLAGDIGTGVLFEDCLAQFAAVACRKALVPGNHDVWVQPEGERDSLTLYREDLPRAYPAGYLFDRRARALPRLARARVRVPSRSS